VNEGQRAIESCIKGERYEMGVEWIEVWTLFAVRYPLVLHSLRLKRPTLVRVTYWRLFLDLTILRQPRPASHSAWICYRAESTNLMRLETSG
jgi:hypothetical protein